MKTSKRNFRSWQRGEIDDATFVRQAGVLAWQWTGLLFVPLWLLVLGALVVKGSELPLVLAVAGGSATFGLAFGYRMAKLGRNEARLRVNKRQWETGAVVPDEPKPIHATVPDIRRFFGPRRRSWRYGCVVLVGVLVIAAVLAALVSWHQGFTARTTMLAIVDGILFCLGAVWLLDRRAYFDLSADGVWCRRWGSERIAFAEFKAVYPRRSGILVGVVLVPRNPDELRRRLSWLGRQALRSGDFGGVTTHADTLTIWTTRLDLPHREFLLALRAAIQR